MEAAQAPRYAIYFAPAADAALWSFGSSVLGYDAATGESRAHPAALTDAFPDWPRLVREPARYGFHATLKAPFRLAEGLGEHDLAAAVAAVAHGLPAVGVSRLRIASLGAFTALVPEAPSSALAELEKAVVERLDVLRAPLDDTERARRRPERLTERQVRHLDRWGYPFVLDEFRFHMTLSGPIEPQRRERVAETLRRLCGGGFDDVWIRELSIFKQPAATLPFVISSRHPLAT